MTIGEAFCGGANHRDLDFDYQRGYITCPEADEQIKADLEEQVGVAGREALIYGLIFVMAAMFLYF